MNKTVKETGEVIRINAVIDIDGTIADLSHRLHHIENPPDWDAFFDACVEDAPIMEILNLVNAFCPAYNLVFVTGRSDRCETQTRAWLNKYVKKYYRLLMRKEGDHRPDFLVKPELMKKANLTPENVAFILEDRASVVKAHREKGFRVLQVAEGDF